MNNRRLVKGDDFGESMIAGVCYGLAEYFGINVTILRFIWVITVFFLWCWTYTLYYFSNYNA